MYNYKYYVEGYTEKRLVEVLSREKKLIKSGKIEIFNVSQKILRDRKILALLDNTIVVFVFDTDCKGLDKLIANKEKLMKSNTVKDVVYIAQVRNLEDEIMRSCQLKNINDLLGTRNEKEFKKKFKECRNLSSKLEKYRFDFDKLWITKPSGEFMEINNNWGKIKA